MKNDWGPDYGIEDDVYKDFPLGVYAIIAATIMGVVWWCLWFSYKMIESVWAQ